MIRCLLLALLAARLPALEILGVDYAQSDKQGHAILGFGVASAAMEITEWVKPEARWYTKAAVGVLAAATVGLVKEYADSRDPLHHCVEADDFVATTSGGAIAALTLCWKF